MKIAYKHSLLNPPKQPCLIHNPAPNCPHLLPVSLQTHSSSSTKSWYIIPNPNLYRPQPHFVLSTKPWYIIPKPNLCCPQPHFVLSTKPWYIIPKPNLCCPQPHSAPSTSSFCIIRCTMVFRPLTHPALSPNPSYIASTPMFSTRSPKAFFFTTHKKRRSKKLLSFTSSSLISIFRSTPLMRDYPIIGRLAFIPFSFRGEDGVSPSVLLSYIDWTDAVHIILVNQSILSRTREALINTQRIAHYLWHECCSIIVRRITC